MLVRAGINVWESPANTADFPNIAPWAKAKLDRQNRTMVWVWTPDLMPALMTRANAIDSGLSVIVEADMPGIKFLLNPPAGWVAILPKVGDARPCRWFRFSKADDMWLTLSTSHPTWVPLTPETRG